MTKVVGTEEAREALWLYYASTATAEEQPLAVTALPYARWIPGDAGWYFGVRYENGAVAIRRVGPKGGISTVISFTAEQWEDAKDVLL